MRRVVLGLALSACLVDPLLAWGWLTPQNEEPEVFDEAAPQEAAPSYEAAPAPPPSQNFAGSDEGLCIAAILEAEQRYNIPQHLLLALGLQEAGYQSRAGLTVWPWTVNAAGEGRRFNSAADAQNFVREKLQSGVNSIDVGCLQINLRWHPDAFQSLSEGFTPRRNADYAARFLTGLYQDAGDWWTAAGRYHSYSDGPQAIYLSQLERNLSVANAKFSQLAALANGAQGWEAQSYDYAADFGENTLMIAPRKHRAPVEYRTEGAIWGGDIAGEEGARRSLYSAQDLEPILPNYLSPES